jgi:PAS domain S-box-containing protein
VDLSGYLLEPLREDGEFVLYRGRAKHPELPSVLLLSPVSSRPSVETLKKIDHEYSLKGELDATWAVRPLAMSMCDDKKVLVLEDLGGEPLCQLIRGPMEIKRFLRLAIVLADAIGQVHKRDLIHKDVKPSNVLVSSDRDRIWLTGFGLASRLARERQSLEAPEFIAGTLAYMAPEQTGRMNRSIDSRSDLYALGVTLYELLTGSLPLTASDPMEWVHCHIARQPVPPHERFGNVPLTVSAIVMKLLAKTPEERYQTAYGARSDLQRVLDEWQTAAAISQYRLGEHDVPDRLLIPETLYGRTSEIEILLTSFDRVVSDNRPELVLVSGYSGIGKSSVVNELHRALVPRRGFFASGKFDQYKRDIPYATLAQAFQGLIRPLLSKSERELSKWREDLQDAVGPNGLLIIDLVPELKLIIGEQPPVPELPLQQAQRRFQLVFRRFVSAFATREHPLALFFDDLQWLDAATLDVLEELLSQSDVGQLMLIGAYRDNEVDASHPLMRRLVSIRNTGAIIEEIALEPLTGEDLARLVVDSFHCEPERATPLASLIQQKTAGNPFFAIQFISALVEERLVHFDYGGGRWVWDLSSIQAEGYTQNVVDLMVGKLNRLSPETQKALQLLACIGNSADFAMLKMVYQGSGEEMHDRLWPAVQAGVILRTDHSYKFLHDRVQEAAYSLIPESSRAEVHVGIGRLLLAHTPPEKLDENIFEIVNQFNRGSHLIGSSEERGRLAELNVIAGRRAKVSTAYRSALSYFRAARTLLTNQSWDENYELIFTIEYETAGCELLSAQVTEAEKRLSMLVQRARSEHDLAIVTRLRATLYTTLDRSDRAVEVCLEFLRRIGTDWSPHPSGSEVQREYDRIWSQLGSRQVENLLDLPLMTNADVLDALDVLAEAVTPALFCDECLSSLVICRMVNLSLEHGNSDASCFAYVWFAIIAGPRFGNYEAAFCFGQLGYDLVERRGLKRFQARTYMSFGDIVLPWRRHVRAGRDLIRRAFHAANEIGDLTFAGYCCDHLVKNMLAAGDPLVEVQREAEHGLAFAEKVRFGLVVDHIKAQLGLVRTLCGLTPKFGSFDDEQFDEHRFERYLASNPALAELECWYWVRKLQAQFFAGDYASAIDASLNAQRQLWTSPSQFEVAELHFYGALSQASSWDSASPDRQPVHFDALAVHLQQLETWAEHCPENFENRAALVKAEMERIEGHDLDAMRFYEQAIRSAHANGFVHNEAIAYEFAARFYAAHGFDNIADSYLREARLGYVRWGAEAKVRQLDKMYPHLKQEEVLSPTSTIGAPVDHLDLTTFLKVSRAVSGEIVLEKLIDTLLRTAVEHAGAERGLLILPRGTDLLVQAEATTADGSIHIDLTRKRVSSIEVPEQVLQYAARTLEAVILGDASNQSSFSDDEYIRRQHSRSILCLPLVKQRKLIALLYLENNLAADVFTARRIALLNVLASAAAISLENGRLYRDLEEREARIRRLVDSNIVGIFLWDFEGRILEANDAFLGIVGYNREDLASGSMRWTTLTPGEWHDRDDHALADLRAVGSTQPYEKEFLRKDGRRVPVLIGGALFEQAGNGGVSFILDLTEQKRAAEALRRTERELRQVIETNRVSTLGELTASLAHEIKQPIGAAVTNAEVCVRLLDRSQPDIAEAREAALEMAKDVRRAADIIDRVRSLFQKSSSELEVVDVNEVIEEMVVMLHNEASRHSVTIHTDLAGGLPQAMADRLQLQQVLMNLMLNGIEAMRDASGELSVKSQLADNGQLLISVADTGVGLPAGNVDKIFDAFFTTKSQGTGLGLAITHSIIKSHGGRIWASANSGRGATFSFTMPSRVAVAA